MKTTATNLMLLVLLLSEAVSCCNVYTDYCDLEERLAQRRHRRSQAEKEVNRTILALTVSRTLDHIFDKNRYDPKIRKVVFV